MQTTRLFLALGTEWIGQKTITIQCHERSVMLHRCCSYRNLLEFTMTCSQRKRKEEIPGERWQVILLTSYVKLPSAAILLDDYSPGGTKDLFKNRFFFRGDGCASTSG